MNLDNKHPESPLPGMRASEAPDLDRTARRRRLSRRKKLLFACAILSFLLVAVSLLSEAALRLYAPQPLVPRYVTDSGYGVRVHSANIAIHHTTPDYRISIRTNSVGMRADREYTLEKPDGVFRIVGLGDSFTFGYGVNVEDTYLARLERLLLESGTNAEVINLGVAGLGTAEELRILQESGLQYDPDLVILGYYVNDLGDNTRSRLYSVDAKGRLCRDQSEYLPAVGVRDWLYSFAAYRFLAERSHLLYLVRRSISGTVRDRQRQTILAAQSRPHIQEWRLTAALVDEIKRTCMERGIGFCLLSIPSARNSTYFLSTVKLCETVAPDDIIDVRPAFDRIWNDEVVYWRRSHNHWTPIGHGIAARALLDHIRPVLP